MEERLTEIRREEALRYMGIRGTPDGLFARDLERCEETLRDAARPRTVWKLFDLEEDGTLRGTSFRPMGQDIRRHLSGAGQVILMAVTLGTETEALIRRAQSVCMPDAMMLDALASAAVESVCDGLCRELARELAPRRLTSRFSPGYGDFPLEQQSELCAVLDVTRRLGITLTPGGLMIPQKSVTAVIGVLEESAEPGIRMADPDGSTESRNTGSGCRSCPSAGSCPFAKTDGDCRKDGTPG